MSWGWLGIGLSADNVPSCVWIMGMSIVRHFHICCDYLWRVTVATYNINSQI